MLDVQKAKSEHIPVMCHLLTELFQMEKDFTAGSQVEKMKAGLNMIISNPDSGQLLLLLENNQII
ncbi:hypothetical protein D3C78_1296880 [compost metagenome]